MPIRKRTKISLTRNELQKYINDGKTIKEISDILGCNITTIYKRVKKQNIVFIPSQYHPKKHSINENYFEKWSNNMAYILGIIITDGCIGKYGLKKGNKRLTFKHKYEDKSILEFIKKEMEYSGEIKINDKKQYYISINSIKIYDCLEQNFFIEQNKTGKERIKFDVPNEFLGDFIRGIFDGDGHVECYGNWIHADICSSSKEFLEDIKKILNIGYIDVDKRSIKWGKTKSGENHKDLYRLCFKKQDIDFLKKLMYKNIKSFCLLRKKQKFYDYTPEKTKKWFKKYSKEEKDFIIGQFILMKNFGYKRRFIDNFIAQKLNRTSTSIDWMISKLTISNNFKFHNKVYGDINKESNVVSNTEAC